MKSPEEILEFCRELIEREQRDYKTLGVIQGMIALDILSEVIDFIEEDE